MSPLNTMERTRFGYRIGERKCPTDVSIIELVAGLFKLLVLNMSTSIARALTAHENKLQDKNIVIQVTECLTNRS